MKAILHSFHESKLAQEYLIQGYIESSLTWNLNDRIVDEDIVQQIFMTLAEKQDGIENETWIKSNEIDNFKESLKIKW
ncbi:MAG: hypothetical protein IKV85_06110 [Ruminococcus sp.]|nr:hypothetical protein [Ruminococcus sp.]